MRNYEQLYLGAIRSVSLHGIFAITFIDQLTVATTVVHGNVPGIT